jgi:hypothetical protein
MCLNPGTLRHGLSAIHSVREFAEAGGLISYGPSIAEACRLIGVYKFLLADATAERPW